MRNPLYSLSQGLVGYWIFNEGTGSRAYDISGNGNYGTLTNMTPNVQGSGWGGSMSGGGLQFDGNDDFVELGTNLFENDYQGTIITRIKTNAQDVSHSFFSSSDITVANNYNHFGISWSTNCVRFQQYSGGVNYYVTGNTPIVAGKWYTVAAISDGTEWRLNINGIEESLVVGGVNDGRWFGDLAAGNHKTRVGIRVRSTSTVIFNGVIDYVQIYNYSLSPTEIKQLHHNPFYNLLRVPIRYKPGLGAGELSIPVAMNYYRRRRIA